MAPVKASVCIPAYGQPDLFRRALESALHQVGVAFDVIVTDDSPDAAVQEVVESFGPSAGIRYLRNPARLGSPANWNRAVSLASGDYIKLLHHDDYLTGTESLRKYVEMLEGHPEADLAFSASEVWMVDSGRRWVHRPAPRVLRALAARPGVLFADNFIGSPSAVIYRRSVVESFDPRLIWLVDVDFYLRMLGTGRAFAFCPEPLVCTTNGGWQVTTRVRGDKALEVFEHLRVYNRIRDAGGLGWTSLKAWARLFAKHGIVSMDEVAKLAAGEEVPANRLRPALWLARLATWGRRAPRSTHGRPDGAASLGEGRR